MKLSDLLAITDSDQFITITDKASNITHAYRRRSQLLDCTYLLDKEVLKQKTNRNILHIKLDI